MAKLTSKYLSGASKLEKQNFNMDTFNASGVTYMDIDKAYQYMGEAKTILGKIHKSYEKIEGYYKTALGKACTASGKKMDTKQGPGKSIKKYYKAAQRRAKAVNNRKATLTSEMNAIQKANEMKQNTFNQNLENRANAVGSVNADEN